MMSIGTRKRIGLVVAVILGLALPSLLAADDQAPAPGSDGFVEYVLGKIDDLYRGRKSHGIMEMKIKTKHWTRNMKAESWSLGTRYSLVRILEPKKEQGTATLKANNDLFMYLNKTGRTVKITSGMMGGSWMGSHFTNDDLVRHTRLSEDFDVQASFEDEQDGTEICYLALTPKPDAPVVWGKIEVKVRQSDLQPLSQRFYDEDGRASRVLEFSGHRNVDGRVMPMKMVMRPLDGSGEFTQITWKKINFDVDLTKGFFTLQKLKSL
jgi:hypothetical protein